MQYTVRFVNQNKIVTVEGGTLAGACEKVGYPLNLVCGGRGVCGKCRGDSKKKWNAGRGIGVPGNDKNWTRRFYLKKRIISMKAVC